jgi:hypothetical protein
VTLPGTLPITTGVRLGSTSQPDFDLTNNTATTEWLLLPDLMIDEADIVLKQRTSTGTPIEINVFNNGGAIAASNQVRVYTDDPDRGGTLLWSKAIGATVPYSNTLVMGNLPGAWSEAWVKVDGAETVTEWNEGDNEQRVRYLGNDADVSIDSRVYLPMVKK